MARFFRQPTAVEKAMGKTKFREHHFDRKISDDFEWQKNYRSKPVIIPVIQSYQPSQFMIGL